MSTQNPVSSHAEASPARADLSRRAILRGAPSVAALAVAAAVPAVAFAATEPDPIFAAIDEHRAAQALVDGHPYGDYCGDLADAVNPIFADWNHTCNAAAEIAEQVLDVEPTTTAGVSAALSHFMPLAIHDGLLPDVPFAGEHIEFSAALLAWAARSLERIAGGANV